MTNLSASMMMADTVPRRRFGSRAWSRAGRMAGWVSGSVTVTGRLVSLADIHLACLPDGSIDGYDWYAIWNLIEKQIEATGWVRVGVEDGPGGWWHWERADAAPMTPVGL
jgi:hypothetical protein